MPAHAPSSGGPSMLGATLGGYKLVREIGRGGMGAVYLAEHTRIVRQAAVKVLLPGAATSPEAVQRFFAEARAASMIQHPGIVEVFDCDITAEGAAFIVMERLHGASLREFIGKGLSRDAAAIADIGGQIATAMAAAHDRGIVHRDLKPDNVFLCEEAGAAGRPRVKLLDFGIAKLLASADAPALTTEGVVMGTPRYMSPEQCNGSRDIGPASDVYSLGCILFEMACGRAPFVADTATALLIAHVSQPPPLPSSLASAVPAGLDGLIVQMLAKAPADRPADMREVERRLLALAEPAPTRRAAPTLPGATESTAVRVAAAPTAPAQATTARPAPAASPEVPGGAAPRRAMWPRLALAAAGVIALALAAGILMARAREARRVQAAAARARIDAALTEAGEIPAPPACQTSDSARLTRLAAMAEAVGRAAGVTTPRMADAASAEEWAMQARAHLAASEDAAALAAAERAVAACPGYASAHYLAGKAADRLGQRERAVDEYRRALNGNDGFIPPRYNLALLQLKAGDASGAAATLDEVIARRADPRALLLRAQARLDTADLAGAESDLRDVVRLAPAQADAWALLGTLHARKGDHEEAKRAFCRGKELGSAAAAANCRE